MKTLSIVCMFGLGIPDFAVDTHVFRYAQQLGWAPSTPERAAHNARAPSAAANWPQVRPGAGYL